ncbi:MAG: sugar nucleotide-binding protein [Candidatus Omnitrophica bacterium]|nr:sugar nucleotide-binding protein [Candidatus Omnitrophota bacterium]
MLPKTAIIGATGLIGGEFLAQHRKIHPDCVGTSRDRTAVGMSFFDLFYPDISPLRLVETGHRSAIIAAGISRLQICHKDPDLSKRIVAGTVELIRQFVKAGIKPIYISSDAVFDGKKGNYDDESPTCPINVYGQEKAEIEQAMKDIAKENYLIARLSKVFTLEKSERNIFDEMASLLMSGRVVRAAYDQVFSCALLSDAVGAVNLLLEKSLSGVFNISSPGAWSRYDLAIKMADLLGIDRSKVEKMSLEDLKEPFKRPKNTSMKITRLTQETNYQFTPIVQCMKDVAVNWKTAANKT